jgi:hypothetical protein
VLDTDGTEAYTALPDFSRKTPNICQSPTRRGALFSYCQFSLIFLLSTCSRGNTLPMVKTSMFPALTMLSPLPMVRYLTTLPMVPALTMARRCPRAAAGRCRCPGKNASMLVLTCCYGHTWTCLSCRESAPLTNHGTDGRATTLAALASTVDALALAAIHLCAHARRRTLLRARGGRAGSVCHVHGATGSCAVVCGAAARGRGLAATWTARSVSGDPTGSWRVPAIRARRRSAGARNRPGERTRAGSDPRRTDRRELAPRSGLVDVLAIRRQRRNVVRLPNARVSAHEPV